MIKTFSNVAMVMVGLTALASAQPAPAPKAAPKAEPKMDPAMAMPKPPAEVAEMGKVAVGTWKCKGDEWDDKGNKSAVTATNKVSLALDNWWINEALEVKGHMTMKMSTFTTYDATAKKWRRVAVMNGGHMIGTSDGMKDNKMTWNMDMTTPMGTGMFRDYMDTSDMKAGQKVWGEMSLDKGKTWLKVYEMTCKK